MASCRKRVASIDDAELKAGGVAALWAAKNHEVKLVVRQPIAPAITGEKRIAHS